MNNDEKNLIGSLKRLKRIEPSQKILAVLEERVLPRVKEKDRELVARKNFVSFRMRPALAVGVMAIVALLIVAATGRDFWQTQYQRASVRTQVALTSNQYEKSRLSLNLSQVELGRLKEAKDKELGPQAAYLAGSVSQTDSYISGLNLSGEPGKYSSRQCESIYREYEDYLGKMEQAVQSRMEKTNDQPTREKLKDLLDQTSQYKQKTESKLQQGWPE